MTTTSPEGQAATAASLLVEQVAAESGTRILASLIGACGGDFQLAEDAFQEGLIAAFETWSKDGLPRNPEGWVFTAARRKAIDQLRRQQLLARKREQLAVLLEHESNDSASEEFLQDDRLRLIFTCCHPALSLEAQIALTLHTVAGLATPEIAKAFLVSHDTMAKRLTRARTKIRDAGIPYQVPEEHELPDRLTSVLTVTYLVFNEGYLSSGESLLRTDLSDEAIRVCRLLAALMPDEPEVMGLLALMLLTDSRRDARTDANGEMQTLEEQDRTRWDRRKIDEGTALIDRVARAHRPGPFQIQAAIAALHAEPQRPEDTDWHQIAFLYDRLLRLTPSPVIALNRAAAVGMAYGPDAGLYALDAVEAEGSLHDYYLLPAARADLLRRSGRHAEAAIAYRHALDLCTNPIEQRYLHRRLTEVTTSS